MAEEESSLGGRDPRGPEKRRQHRGRAGPRRPDPPDVIELLVQGNPRRLLPVFVEGDPGGIRRRCIRRIEARSLIVQSDRLFLRAAARIASAMQEYRNEILQVASWLDHWIDRSIDEILEEDRAACEKGEPSTGAFAELAQQCDMPLEEVRRTVVSFHSLEEEARQSFYRRVLRDQPLEAYARQEETPLGQVAELARQAIVEMLAKEEGR